MIVPLARILYRNHAGIIAVRTVEPREVVPMWFGRSEHHKRPDDRKEWFLSARCVEKGHRVFAMADVLAWGDDEINKVLAFEFDVATLDPRRFAENAALYIADRLPTKE